MLRLALIGKDVSRSKSPELHRFILDELGENCIYEKISVSPANFEGKVERLFEEYDCFNVTIPFKETVLPHLSALRGDAERLRTVNTVLTKERTGYNTDGGGFQLMLETEDIVPCGKTVLVLGAGGAGRSCIDKLIQSGAKVYAYDVDKKRLQAVYCEIGGFTPLRAVSEKQFELIVNCTGVGMHDTVGRSPADGKLLSLCSAAVDLIYEPAQSEFLRLAADFGRKTVNGEGMLFYQAYLTDCILMKRTPGAKEAKALYKKYKETQT